MNKQITNYTFEIKGKVTVTLDGCNTDENYDLALQIAVQKASIEVGEDWIHNCITKTGVGYEGQ